MYSLWWYNWITEWVYSCVNAQNKWKTFFMLHVYLTFYSCRRKFSSVCWEFIFFYSIFFFIFLSTWMLETGFSQLDAGGRRWNKRRHKTGRRTNWRMTCRQKIYICLLRFSKFNKTLALFFKTHSNATDKRETTKDERRTTLTATTTHARTETNNEEEIKRANKMPDKKEETPTDTFWECFFGITFYL